MADMSPKTATAILLALAGALATAPTPAEAGEKASSASENNSIHTRQDNVIAMAEALEKNPTVKDGVVAIAAMYGVIMDPGLARTDLDKARQLSGVAHQAVAVATSEKGWAEAQSLGLTEEKVAEVESGLARLDRAIEQASPSKTTETKTKTQ